MTAPFDFSSPLRSPTITSAKKVIQLNPLFKTSLSRLTTDLDRNSYVALIEAIKAGDTLAPYYRAGLATNTPPDTLLETKGVMHLHIGGQNSNNLLYLMQFQQCVLLLKVGGHAHMPTGTGLPLHAIKSFQDRYNAQLAATEQAAQEKLAAKNRDIRARVLKRAKTEKLD